MAASISRGVPVLGPFHIPAFGTLTSPRVRVLGIIGLLFLLQLFVWLGTVINTNASGDSALLPGTGNWTLWSNVMLFYLVMNLFSMILVNYTGDVAVVPKAKDISMFLVNYSLWTVVGWGILTLIFPHGTGVTMLLGTGRIQQFTIISLFVAPSEELMFRVVLPRVLNSWFLGSTVAFTIFHLSAYSVEYSGSEFIPGLISLVLMSFVLWGVYAFQLRIRLKGGKEAVINSGFGGSVGLHQVYDCFVLGVLGPLFGGVPI